MSRCGSPDVRGTAHRRSAEVAADCCVPHGLHALGGVRRPPIRAGTADQRHERTCVPPAADFRRRCAIRCQISFDDGLRCASDMLRRTMTSDASSAGARHSRAVFRRGSIGGLALADRPRCPPAIAERLVGGAADRRRLQAGAQRCARTPSSNRGRLRPALSVDSGRLRQAARLRRDDSRRRIGSRCEGCVQRGGRPAIRRSRQPPCRRAAAVDGGRRWWSREPRDSDAAPTGRLRAAWTARPGRRPWRIRADRSHGVSGRKRTGFAVDPNERLANAETHRGLKTGLGPAPGGAHGLPGKSATRAPGRPASGFRERPLHRRVDAAAAVGGATWSDSKMSACATAWGRRSCATSPSASSRIRSSS